MLLQLFSFCCFKKKKKSTVLPLSQKLVGYFSIIPFFSEKLSFCKANAVADK